MIEFIGIIAFPIAFMIFRCVPDRGITLAMPLGIVIAAYFTWILSYTDLISGLQKFYQKECRQHLIDYVPIFTDQNLDLGLTGYLNKRKKLG